MITKRMLKEQNQQLALINDELEADRNNLNLYLYWLEKNFHDVFEDMATYFDGMPSYTSSIHLKLDDLPEDFIIN